MPNGILVFCGAGGGSPFVAVARDNPGVSRPDLRRLRRQKIALPSTVLTAATGLDLDGRIDVVSDERPFSFCYWFLRPRICLSTALVERLDADELRAVLHHERYHLRQRDPLRQIVARYFAAGLYVVPVVDELLAFHTLQKEIDADQEAVRASGEVRSLASALYRRSLGRRAGSCGRTRRVQGRRERRIRDAASALRGARASRRPGQPLVRGGRRRRPSSTPTTDSASVQLIHISWCLLQQPLVAELC